MWFFVYRFSTSTNRRAKSRRGDESATDRRGLCGDAK